MLITKLATPKFPSCFDYRYSIRVIAYGHISTETYKDIQVIN